MTHHRVSGRLRSIVCGLAVLSVVFGLVAGATSAAAAPRAGGATAPPVSVFPRPGSQAANPPTTISLRGMASGAIGAISVIGDKTGVHQGTWVAHSDGEGASFDPSTAFAPGEHITVHTHLDVLDAGGDTFGFTVERPSSVLATIAD